MKLPGLPFRKKVEPSAEVEVQMHFALRITGNQLQAAVWRQEGDGVPSMVATSQFWNWDGESEESLITQADQALGECTVSLPEDVTEPNTVLFGVPANWVHKGDLLPHSRQTLKKITESLELKALGFVVSGEAIINYLNGHGNRNLHGLLIGIDEKILEISLCVQGMVQLSHTEARSKDLVADVIKGIHHLDQGHLPPKMFLFNGDADLSEIHKQLMHFDWQSAPVGFMHIPQIELLSVHLPIEAVVFSVVEPEAIQAHKGEEVTVTAEAPTEAEAVEMVEETEESGKETAQAGNSQLLEVGFVKNGDIREVTDTAFTAGDEDDVEEIPDEVMVEEQLEVEEKPAVDEERAKEEAAVVQPKLKKRRMFRFPWKILVGLVLLLGLGVGGVWWVMSQTKAVVVLTLTPQLLEKEFTVVVNPELESDDAESGVLAGSVLTTRATGESSLKTTGSSMIGEQATGEVTIFNDTDTSRTLDAGTKLTSSNNLVFTLDEEVQIASKSVDLTSDQLFTPGTAKAKVTAAKIGPDYNLKAQTAFRVANFSQSVLLARNDKEFGGGSSREIEAVAQVDLDSLLNELDETLKKQAMAQLTQQLQGEQDLITSSIQTEWVSKKFSHKVGEEAKEVSLDGEVKYTAVAYSKAAFEELARGRLANEVPSGKQLSDKIETSFKLLDEQEGDEASTYSFSVVTKSYLMPEIEVDKVKEKIAGQTPDKVEGYLGSLPSVNRVEKTISPRLPSILNRYPFDTGRIEIELKNS